MSTSHWCGGDCNKERCILTALKSAAEVAKVAKAKQIAFTKTQKASGLPPKLKAKVLLTKFDKPRGMHPVMWAQMQHQWWR